MPVADIVAVSCLKASQRIPQSCIDWQQPSRPGLRWAGASIKQSNINVTQQLEERARIFQWHIWLDCAAEGADIAFGAMELNHSYHDNALR